MRTYSRWAALAARLTFAPGASPAELIARFPRIPPLSSTKKNRMTSYDSIPSSFAMQRPTRRWPNVVSTLYPS